MFVLTLIVLSVRISYPIYEENLSIEIIKPRSKPFIVTKCYGPPNSSFELFSQSEDFVGKLDADDKMLHHG